MAFLAIFFALFTITQTFLATEKFVVLLMFGTVIFNWIIPRVLGYQEQREKAAKAAKAGREEAAEQLP